MTNYEHADEEINYKAWTARLTSRLNEITRKIYFFDSRQIKLFTVSLNRWRLSFTVCLAS